jgi:hypothetical protein
MITTRAGLQIKFTIEPQECSVEFVRKREISFVQNGGYPELKQGETTGNGKFAKSVLWALVISNSRTAEWIANGIN